MTSAAIGDVDQKAWETLRARLCLRGVAVTRIEADDGSPLYIANLGAWTKSCNDIAELERFVQRVEGSA